MRRSLLLTLLLLSLALACNLNRLGGDRPQAIDPPPGDGAGERPKATAPSGAGKAPKAAAAPAPTPTPQVTTAATLPLTATLPVGQDGWTVLIYMNADNDLELPALLDVNEMEAAGQPERVNVLVQLDRIPGDTAAAGDWTGARRLQIAPDEDPSQITSAAVADLGEVNMGAPEALADFLVWGIQNYPARHYALVLWDHGGGWSGIAFDDSSNDALTMDDLGGALQQALAQTGLPQLDVVAFDACLMGQVEVYQAIQPYARYAVGSEELIPAQGWHYETLLRDLYAAPEMGAARLAQLMVATYADYYTHVEPDPRITMSAVDLHALPRVGGALEQMAQVLLVDPAYVAAAVGDARDGAEAYSLIYPDDADYYAAVDLWHFASILAQRSPDEAVTAAAQQVMAAVEDAVIVARRGDAFKHSRGVAVHFPRTAEFYAPAYDAIPLPSWQAFVRAYHDAAAAHVSLPELSIVQLADAAGSVQQPVYLEVEISGRNVSHVFLSVARREADGRLRLVEYDYLVPEPTRLGDGSALYEWRDGVHEDFFVWDTTAVYLTDGENGAFAVLWPTGYESDLYSVQGRYRRAGGDAYLEAMLVFDVAAGRLDSVWSFQGGERRNAPRELLPAAGDTFQVYDIYLEATGELSYQPGATVVFDEAGQLDGQLGGQIGYEERPLPGGDYVLGFSAETISGDVSEAFVDVAVANDDLAAGYRAYLDPYSGFQFFYPATWYEPTYRENQLLSSDAAEETWLAVTLYPHVGRGSPADLIAETLQRFGTVDVLYEEPVLVDGRAALLAAYGYETEAGAHTGLFVTFVDDELDMGFVVDVDGPAAAEAETIAIVNRIADSWTFRPLGFGLFPGNWSRLDLEAFSVPLPEDFSHRELENGWQLFSDEDAVVALRADPVSGKSRPDLALQWIEVAGDGVDGFSYGDPYRFALEDQVWARSDFEYESAGSTLWGFVMATIIGGEEVVAWAEAPSAVYNEMERDVFLVLIADALAQRSGESGLLYEETFATAGPWGTGERSGASGSVVDGSYQLAVTAAEGFFWATAGQSFADGVYEVEATQLAAPLDSGYGMVLRAAGEGDSFYVFEVSGDGYVWIGRCQNGCAQAVTLVDEGWFPSAAVKQGLQVTNRLRVEADGPLMRFFVNGEEVGRVRDETLGAGDFGFFVETLGEGGVRVAFDNLRVTAR